VGTTPFSLAITKLQSFGTNGEYGVHSRARAAYLRSQVHSTFCGGGRLTALHLCCPRPLSSPPLRSSCLLTAYVYLPSSCGINAPLARCKRKKKKSMTVFPALARVLKRAGPGLWTTEVTV
jgi:hypothetical protein